MSLSFEVDLVGKEEEEEEEEDSCGKEVSPAMTKAQCSLLCVGVPDLCDRTLRVIAHARHDMDVWCQAFGRCGSMDLPSQLSLVN